MLCKGFRIALRRSLTVVKLVGKFNHAVFENHQSAAKLSQFAYQLYDAHTLFVLFIKNGCHAEFLRCLYVGNGVLCVFSGEDLLNVTPVGRKIKQRKGIGGAHHLRDLQYALLGNREMFCGRRSVPYQFHNRCQRNGKLYELSDMFIGNIHGSTTDTARRHGVLCIGHFVFPEIQRQQILIKYAHVPTSYLSCFFFSSIIPYICDKI